MNWLSRYFLHRRIRKHSAWVKKMRRKHIILAGPITDSRDWMGNFKRSLK